MTHIHTEIKANEARPTNPVDDFLNRYSDEIAQPYRSWIRDSAAKAIQGVDIDMNHCPAHLRSELLDIIITEAEKRRERIAAEYIERNRKSKQTFLTGKSKTWV